MYSETDIIVAPATGMEGPKPLSIIRISGNGCWELVQKYFKSRKEMESWVMVYGNWLDDEGVVDDVMLVGYRAPRSYTSQDMVEVFCHGNPLFVEIIIKGLVRGGARRARPGEFTIRAVINGKMDLLKAESINGLIEANTRYQADLIRRQAKGPIVEFVKAQVDEIIAIQAHIEASIDYGEEDLDVLERSVLLGRIKNLLTRFEQLRETGRFANAMKRGFRVLITGEPNVGKSTLFNYLVREERAIVTHLPGTTRDLINEEIEIGGLPVVLIDSAGVRDTDDLIEQMGIEKIFGMLEDVDLILYLSVSGDVNPPYEKVAQLPKHRWIHVLTKSDVQPNTDSGKIAVSALQGVGLKQLEDEVVVRLSTAMEGQSVYLINRRQEDLVCEVLQQLSKAHDDYVSGFGEEVLSSYLNTARRHLGELTGETTVEDILDRMFSTFCLGK